jgi:hypothetical protein
VASARDERKTIKSVAAHPGREDILELQREGEE